MSERVNVTPCFWGRNRKTTVSSKKMLNFLMNDHAEWRRDFHPDDKPVVTAEDQSRRARATRTLLNLDINPLYQENLYSEVIL